MKILVGYFQFAPVWGLKKENLLKVENALASSPFTYAKKERVALLVLPELFATGYLFLSPEEVLEMAEPIPNGLIFQTLLRLSREYQTVIVGGIPAKVNNKVYNSAIIVTPDSTYEVYHKIHLFADEKRLFTPGDQGFKVFNYKGIKVGLLICFDYFFPEATRTLVLEGTEIIAHPSNLMLPYAPLITKVRALENHIFWILANRTGTEERNGKKLKFIGKSQIVSPKGEILAHSSEEEELKVIEIDLEKARDKKVTKDNDLILDRRPEFYRI